MEELESFNSEFRSRRVRNYLGRTIPTVKMCYGLIRRRIPAIFWGAPLADRMPSSISLTLTLDDLKNKIDICYSTHLEKAREKGHTSKIATLEDRHQCFAVFFDMMPDESRTIAGLKRQIESLFSDKNKENSCHLYINRRARNGRTSLLDVHLMPSKYAVQHSRGEEPALVTITAQTNLFYITSDGWM